VNEFGMSNFPESFRPMPRPRPPQRGSESSRPFLVFLLILACVGTGALWAWGLREHNERARLFERNLEVEKSYVVVLAKRSDLAGFLTDQRTHFFHLVGRSEANGQVATVAWQEESHTGFLVADKVAPLSDHEIYAMWHLDGDHKPALCGGFQPDPTGTIYDFQCPDPSQGTGGFLISIEPDRNAKAPSRIVYETR
jgi:Anti-sigma-K factor rskA